jgi:hypothetical protein
LTAWQYRLHQNGENQGINHSTTFSLNENIKMQNENNRGKLTGHYFKKFYNHGNKHS